MKRLSILLVCGSGASSGFMAANMRKACAEAGLDAEIKARSESEIENYIDEVDAIMVGPHLEYAIDELNEYYGDQAKIILMKSDYYATLNGTKAIAHFREEMGL